MMNQVGVFLTAVPPFATKVCNFFHAATVALIVISVPVAVFAAVWFTIKWYTADENDKPAALKKVKNVIVGAVIVVSIEGLLTWILSFFTS